MLLPYKAIKRTEKFTRQGTVTSKTMSLGVSSAEKEKINILHTTPYTLHFFRLKWMILGLISKDPHCTFLQKVYVDFV